MGKIETHNSTLSMPKTRLRNPEALFPLVGLIFFLILPLVVKSPYILHVFIFIFIYSALGSAWNIIGGYAGQWSLGHAAFFGIGAYTSTLLLINFNITPWIGMLVGGLVSITISLLIAYPCFNLRTHYFAMATVTFGEIMRLVFLWLPFTGGAMGQTMPVGKIPSLYLALWASKLPYYYLALILAVGAVMVTIQIDRSRLGMYLKSIKDDEDAARNLGINATKYKLVAMGISSFLTALMGSVYAQYIQYIEPDAVMPFMLSIMMILIPIFGGVGTVLGPVLGAVILMPVAEISRVLWGGRGAGLDLFIYGVIIVVFALYFPGGLMSYLTRGKSSKGIIP